MCIRDRGAIVTVSSMWGRVGASCEVAYSASKAAVIGLTRALAKELGPSGVRVNFIVPVSYTHLDVYKRQGIESRIILNPIS